MVSSSGSSVRPSARRRRPRPASPARPLPLRARRRGAARPRLLRGLQHPGQRPRAAAARHRRRLGGQTPRPAARAQDRHRRLRRARLHPRAHRRCQGVRPARPAAHPHPRLHDARLRDERAPRATRSAHGVARRSRGRSSTSARGAPRCSRTWATPFGRGEEVYDVTFENVQAGLRTDYLFRIANQRGGIVLGTGDLSELALGWCTYGVGDQMSHYGVNAGVPKTLMQHLIRWVVSSGQLEQPMPRAASTTCSPRSSTQEISPELIPAKPGEKMQSTEDSIGPYALHDFTLFHVLRRGYRPSKIAFLACTPGRMPSPPASGRRVTRRPTTRHTTWRRSSGGAGLPLALLRQPVQALGPAQRPQGRERRARCRRAATGGCRRTRKAWLDELDGGVPGD
jgi:NH3-dependent NAD+ synthetase